nr:MAG TPA: hypothetical protein [Caudoviricetes sp.]
MFTYQLSLLACFASNSIIAHFIFLLGCLPFSSNATPQPPSAVAETLIITINE